MEKNIDDYLRDLKELFENNEAVSTFDYEIYKIEENFGDYCLSLRIEDFLIKGIHIKTKDILQEKQIIYNFQFYLDKSNEEIKIYIRNLIFRKVKKNNLKEKSKMNKPNIVFDFKPELIKSSINDMKLFKGDLKGEDVLIFIDLKDTIMELFDPINYTYYYMNRDEVKHLTEIKKNDFIFLKYHLIYKDNIFINNLTFIQKANEFQIFSILDKKIPNRTSDFCELKEIKEEDEKEYIFIFGKVILKNIKEKYILIIDKFNKIVKLNYNIIPNLDLFDLLFIYHCRIKKSPNDKYYYLLNLEKNSLIYQSKKLILNKSISINNYSILNVNIPDFKEKNNYYNQIIISDFHEINNIKSNNHVYVFKLKNEIFNEIIPFNIKIKNNLDKKEDMFKFFINHNLMTNINIWINYKGEEKCSIDYCYYNYRDKVPFFHEIKLNKKEYYIDHYNSFNNYNEIGFILVNIPPDENTNKIPNTQKDKIISSQIWLTSSQIKNKNKYHPIQILNIDEAKPKKIYYSYNLNSNNYSLFDDFYFNMNKFYIQNTSKDKIFKYFNNMDKIYEEYIKKDFEEKISHPSIRFIPETADFYTFKLFANLLLFKSLKELKNNNKNKTICDLWDSWNMFLDNYFNLIDKLNELSKLLTYHQKIRIIYSYTHDVLLENNQLSYSTRFLYISDKFLKENNSYLLAFKFNIDVINKLTEKSILAKGYKVFDSYTINLIYIILFS